MFELLFTVIPLDLASTLSPEVTVLILIALGSKKHPKIRAEALLIGTAVVGAILGLLGFALGMSTPDKIGPSLVSSLIDLVIGLVFIFLAIKTLTGKEREIKTSEVKGKQIFKWFLLGVMVSAINFDALLFTFTAGREVGAAAINEISKFLLLFVNLLFFTLPASLPLAIYLLFPNFAGPFLKKANYYVLKYCKYIIFALFFVLGIVFIRQGIMFFCY